MAIINHIAYINTQTGEIERIQLCSGVVPAEGLDEETGYLLKHIYDHLSDPSAYMETTYWDLEDEAFTFRPEKPNPYAYWTEAKAWMWNDGALLQHIRRERNAKLRETDWTQLPDASLSEAEKEDAAQYRQNLRDMTEPFKEDPYNYPHVDSLPRPTPPPFLSSEI